MIRKNAPDIPNAQNQIQLFPLLLSNFIGTLGFSIVLPFLVFLVKDFGGNAIVFGILSERSYLKTSNVMLLKMTQMLLQAS